MNIRKILFINFSLMFLLGLLYYFQFFGLNELLLKLWGVIAIILGTIGIILSNLKRFYKKISIAINIIQIIVQIPLIYFWIKYKKFLEIDSIDTSISMKYYFYIMPNILIILLSFYFLYLIIRKKTEKGSF
ncbi:hypothetical protein ciss_22680 [Carboxydothermus islandicus]|uniref:Uncharacterized protein n=1 Tax=Carboxydothermus islandicus TaxID=661089 RepID=A0A1L8D575_9THEO|nr:hypothetical protein [Carboxydothermus islandicus]GAV26335.1 hypothetical protein ciss_22680 [Carboxydothermus islandicus]